MLCALFVVRRFQGAPSCIHVWVIHVLAEIKMYLNTNYYVHCLLSEGFREHQVAYMYEWFMFLLRSRCTSILITTCIVCCQTHWWWPWTYIRTGRSVCEVHAWHSRVLASAGRQGMESFCKQRCLQLVNMYSFELCSALRHTLMQTGFCRRSLGVSCWVVPFSANNMPLRQEAWLVCVLKSFNVCCVVNVFHCCCIFQVKSSCYTSLQSTVWKHNINNHKEGQRTHLTKYIILHILYVISHGEFWTYIDHITEIRFYFLIIFMSAIFMVSTYI